MEKHHDVMLSVAETLHQCHMLTSAYSKRLKRLGSLHPSEHTSHLIHEHEAALEKIRDVQASTEKLAPDAKVNWSEVERALDQLLDD